MKLTKKKLTEKKKDINNLIENLNLKNLKKSVLLTSLLHQSQTVLLRKILIFQSTNNTLKYFNLNPSFQLPWCPALNFFEFQIPIITVEFETQSFAIR